MTNFNAWLLVSIAEDLDDKLNQTMVLDDANYNQQFHAQREMLVRFYDFFHRHLAHILSQMDSDIGTLRARGFDSNMRRLFGQVYKRLEEIYKKIDTNKPYPAAQELVDYVGDRHHRSIIDNLEFLAQHHLKATKPETAIPLASSMKHILEARSLPMVKELAEKLQEHMQEFPLIQLPPLTPIPPPGFTPAIEHPAQQVGEGEVTNPAIPLPGMPAKVKP